MAAEDVSANAEERDAGAPGEGAAAGALAPAEAAHVATVANSPAQTQATVEAPHPGAQAPLGSHAAGEPPLGSHAAGEPPLGSHAAGEPPLGSHAAGEPPLYAAQTTPALGAVPQQRPVVVTDTALVQLPEHDAWIGRVLDGRYRVTERLGEGGMGAVFVAEHLKLKKPVALKVIRKELAGNGEVAARFAREAMATAQFEHPHVASAIDFGTLAEGGAYLVMQLVRGESLRALLDRRGALPWPLACELLAQVADALSAARGAGIVHRDLKPENILVETRDDGSYLTKILDFGIAHVMQPNASPPDAHQRALTRVGTVMGTPGYMSPEQAVGDRVDHRTDLYALGVVLWECLTGKPLWDGPDVTTIITKQLRDPVPTPREVLGDPLFPRALDQLVIRLCARTPEERPEHAGLVRDELRNVARQPITPALAIAERATHTYHTARKRFETWPRSSRLLFGAGAAALLLMLVLSSGRGSRHDEPKPAAAVAPSEQAAPDPDALARKPKPRGEETTVSTTKPQPKPSLADRALQLAERMVNETPLIKPEVKPVIPKELEPDVKVMLESSRSSERRRAALKVLRYKGPSKLPAHVVSIARLERARTCRERQDAIAELEELGDKRALSSLRRIEGAPRTGCGFLGLSDCYGCIRGDVRDAIAHLASQE